MQIGFGTTQDLLYKLNQGKIDLMLSFYEAGAGDANTSERLFSSCLALIVHQNHPLAYNKKIDIRQLEHTDFILPSGGYSIRTYLDGLLQKHQLSLEIKMEVNDINTLLQLVNSWRRATILMGSSVYNHPELKAIKITSDGMTRLATITSPMGAYRKKSALMLMNFLKANAKDYHVEDKVDI